MNPLLSRFLLPFTNRMKRKLMECMGSSVNLENDPPHHYEWSAILAKITLKQCVKMLNAAARRLVCMRVCVFGCEKGASHIFNGIVYLYGVCNVN